MERAAINAPLQGTAADIIKRAMIRIPEALSRRRLKARMLLQVHDELLFEAPKAEIEETAAVVKKVMEEAPMPARVLSVPLIAEHGAALTGPTRIEGLILERLSPASDPQRLWVFSDSPPGGDDRLNQRSAHRGRPGDHGKAHDPEPAPFGATGEADASS
jgi:hypothetical protein